MEQAIESDLPLPGAGSTWPRWCAFIELAQRDLAAARLAEGHHDAVAILSELGAERPPGFLGVWAAEPARTVATLEAGEWRLRGQKSWCSGASSVEWALVTATAPDGPRLYLVDVRSQGVEPIEGTWPSMGMAATDSGAVAFDLTVPETAAVGQPGAYTDRAGFWHGGAGVAACWYGGAISVAERLRGACRDRPDPHRLAAFGSVLADLAAAGALLRSTAAAIDRDPGSITDGRRVALTVRAAVWAAGRRLLDATEGVLGARPLCLEPGFAADLLDLRTYLAQHHGPGDLAQLGEAGLDQKIEP